MRALGFLADIPGWAMMVVVTAAGIGAGWVCERLLARWAHWARRRTASAWDDVLLESVHRLPMIWFAAIALYLGVSVAGYGEPLRGLVGSAVSVIMIVTFLIVAMRLATAGITGFAKRSTGVETSTTLVQNVVRLLLLILGTAPHSPEPGDQHHHPLRVPVRQFTDQFLVRHELVKRIHERYGSEGIEIPFPIRTVHMRERAGSPE